VQSLDCVRVLVPCPSVEGCHSGRDKVCHYMPGIVLVHGRAGDSETQRPRQAGAGALHSLGMDRACPVSKFLPVDLTLSSRLCRYCRQRESACFSSCLMWPPDDADRFALTLGYPFLPLTRSSEAVHAPDGLCSLPCQLHPELSVNIVTFAKA